MKEAAGEANMTVITIVLIAIVLAVGTIIVTNLMRTTSLKSACNNIGGTVVNGTQCQVKNNVTGETTTVSCTASGNVYKCG